jgi:predicted PurR-regulated permease PerM
VVGILISVPLCSILYTLINEGIEMRLKGHAAELEKSEERIEKS